MKWMLLTYGNGSEWYFQKPNPFPQSILNNVAYGPRVLGLSKKRTELDEIVETSLRQAALWDEVRG